MFKTLLARARQGYRTTSYPAQDPAFPALFRGRPEIDAARCIEGCAACVEACPADALSAAASGLQLDLGRCIFCAECAAACPEGAISFTGDWRLAGSTQNDLVIIENRRPQVERL